MTDTEIPPHTCHAYACKKVVPEKMFMCGKHWKMVPRPLQAAIWAAYVPGQEVRKDPSREYLRVAILAVQKVHEKEGL